jgi:hypothetical protein
MQNVRLCRCGKSIISKVFRVFASRLNSGFFFAFAFVYYNKEFQNNKKHIVNLGNRIL